MLELSRITSVSHSGRSLEFRPWQCAVAWWSADGVRRLTLKSTRWHSIWSLCASHELNQTTRNAYRDIYQPLSFFVRGQSYKWVTQFTPETGYLIKPSSTVDNGALNRSRRWRREFGSRQWFSWEVGYPLESSGIVTVARSSISSCNLTVRVFSTPKGNEEWEKQRDGNGKGHPDFRASMKCRLKTDLIHRYHWQSQIPLIRTATTWC